MPQVTTERTETLGTLATLPYISESATRSTKDSEDAIDMMTQLGLVNVDVLQMMHHGSIEGSILVRNQSCEILNMIQQAELK